LPEVRRASHCWAFCGGWHPERWPIYDALHDVPDWQALIELMTIIRDANNDKE